VNREKGGVSGAPLRIGSKTSDDPGEKHQMVHWCIGTTLPVSLLWRCCGIAVAALCRCWRLRAKILSPFAKPCPTLKDMARKRKGLEAVLREITHSAERSSLFWWMVEHHDELAEAAQGRRLRWEPLCKRFAMLALTDASGKPPGPRTARETWMRARRAVATTRARSAAKGPAEPRRKPPSRISPEWRPLQAPSPVSSALAEGGPPEPYDPDKQLARIVEIIKSRSGQR
jgi:hypothetical protein